jgi:MFS family permease
MPLLLPAISDELDVSLTVAGTLGTTNLAAYLTGVVVVTWLAGRAEPVLLLRAGVAVVIAGLVVLSVAGGLAMLFCGTALAGLGGAGIWINAPGIATADVEAERRGAVLSLLTATMGGALVLIPQITALIRIAADDDQAWRQVWAFEVVAALGVLAALVVLVRPARTEPVPGGLSLSHLRSVSGWVPATVAYVAYAYIVASFVQFLALALEDDAGFSSGHVAVVFSVLGLFSILGPVVLGRLSDRRGRRSIMVLAMGAMAAGALLVTVGREPFVLLGAVLFGVSSFSYPVLAAAFVRDHAAARAFGAAFGMMTIFYGFGAMAGPVTTGAIGDSTGSFTAAYLVVAAVALVGGGAAWRLPRDRRPLADGGPLAEGPLGEGRQGEAGYRP